MSGQNTKNGKLFVLTGIDGSGKSGVLSILAKQHPKWEIGSYDPETWIPSDAPPNLAWMREQDPRNVVARLSPQARASFLGHMILTHWELWLQPKLKRGATVLTDSYFLRFWAREWASSGEYELLESMVQNLPRPDCTVFLDVPPEVAAGRKTHFDACETGGSSDSTVVRKDFIVFQKKVAAELQMACERWSERWFIVSGDQPPQQVAQQVEKIFVDFGS